VQFFPLIALAVVCILLGLYVRYFAVLFFGHRFPGFSGYTPFVLPASTPHIFPDIFCTLFPPFLCAFISVRLYPLFSVMLF